jgi:hypothetical protein
VSPSSSGLSEQVTGGWEELHIEEYLNMYFSLNIFGVFKSRIIKMAWSLACIRDTRNAYKILARRSKCVGFVLKQILKVKS